MKRQDQYTPERLADRAQIQDVMYRWCRSVDRLDLVEMRKVFHPDATDAHGIFNGGVDDLITWISARHKPIPFSMHSISNMLIEFASPDAALVETYVRTVQRYPAEASAALSQLASGQEGPPTARDLLTCSRYVDRFERRNGEWRISRRTLVQDWKQVVDVPTNAPQAVGQPVVGRRDQQDKVFQERKELGIHFED
ncbi:MAG: nuclear transport factor 2 family protein [Janthinobacterium lividum]